MRLAFALVTGVVLGLSGAGGVFWFLQAPESPAVSRYQEGRRVAEKLGCFLCHGPDGKAGTTNFIPELDEVPAWSQGNFAAYVKSKDEVREWILDGAPTRMLSDPTEKERIEKQLIKMPAYRGLVGSEQELEDLVYYVTAAGLLVPLEEESVEGKGRAVAIRLGCFGCHGPQGLGRAPNAGSLKGYIPAWSSSDYDELVHGHDELREWVLDGAPKRLRSNPAANFFLTRQVVKMPAYRGRITDEELSELIAYIDLVRAQEGRSGTARLTARSTD